MAKWGEGDPRWIVEERADATNVNNWHWTERDVTGWSTDKLKELLLGLRVEGLEGSCEVTDVPTLDGEASINNRKGKLIYFYEWNVKATWTGTTKTGIKYKGNIEVPNLSDENDMDDLDISVSLCKDEPNTTLTELMKKEGAKKVRAALGSYVDHLKSEFTQGMILPTANGVASKPQPAQTQTKVKVDKTQIGSSVSTPSPSTGVKIPTCKFSLKETFLTSPDELYRTFINQDMVQAFTHTAAVVDGDKGGKFQLLEGSVNGEFMELVPDEKIVMKWRFKTWPCEHYATITLNMKDRGNETELKVECKGVPTGEEDRTKEGWKRYYFEAIKQTFGFGARLY
ncbi:activator of 90 kDa heat shock protein ATPase homolog 1a isoform X2 [Coregonus clupeaformis]|uniref:Activator of 90 kDa heat shock protein ATPase homolog 1 n=1 Tax=Coregonus suidteri TaxID=861788 RepID=A0AAN8KQ14_9TELE|nr:activator of 90 kDa heat shock protein ATPase homolog 1a isoform X2 [Coregonus clupeaformis]XP_041721288.1 activator of 90 kDa heat shock protein ATPase homolog 1a isoform X2 [Coregonus clupeaformis]